MLQQGGILNGIEAGRAFFKVTEYRASLDKTLEFHNGFLIGRGVDPCGFLSHESLQFLINQAMLGCDFCGCALGLSAADSVCFQDDHLFPRL